MYNEAMMKRAVQLAQKVKKEGEGDPFGCVIVQGGEVVAEEGNKGFKTFDPTTHAELEAVRTASRFLKTQDLSDCELYTSGEPCPMCEAAINWSGIPVVYTAKTAKEAENAGLLPIPETTYELHYKPLQDKKLDPYLDEQ